MNRQTKRLLAKQEKKAERDRARTAGSGRGGGPAGPTGPGGGGGGGGKGPGGGGSGPSPAKGEKEGRLKRMRRFLREVRQELKKVAWPSKGEIATYSVVVLVSVIALTLLVAGLDWVFGEGAFRLFRT